MRQLARIEHWQTCVRRIHENIAKSSPDVLENERVSQSPEAHHHIGLAENSPQVFGLFLRSHSGDPAIVVGLSLSTKMTGI